MTSFTFTPKETPHDRAVPFFEDARTDYAPYYASKKKVSEAQAQVREEMGKHKGSIINFQVGEYKIKQQDRWGYQIHFAIGDQLGVIRVAGLPIREKTDARVDRVLVQALLNVAAWLKISVVHPIFFPGTHPLLLKMLWPGSKKTIEEHLLSADGPLLLAPVQQSAGTEVAIEGTFTEHVE